MFESSVVGWDLPSTALTGETAHLPSIPGGFQLTSAGWCGAHLAQGILIGRRCNIRNMLGSREGILAGPLWNMSRWVSHPHLPFLPRFLKLRPKPENTFGRQLGFDISLVPGLTLNERPVSRLARVGIVSRRLSDRRRRSCFDVRSVMLILLYPVRCGSPVLGHMRLGDKKKCAR